MPAGKRSKSRGKGSRSQSQPVEDANTSEPEESIGAQRRVPSNGVLVKMLVGAMLVKETDEFEKQSLHPDVAASMALLLFVFTTLLTWSYYGERAITFMYDRIPGSTLGGEKILHMIWRVLWCV